MSLSSLNITDFLAQHALGAYLVLVGSVAVQRLLELRRSARHEAALHAQGGVEVAAGQVNFTLMRVVHTAWLVGCVSEAWWRQVPPALVYVIPAVAVFLLGQVLRWAAMQALQERWTVRVMVRPGEPVVTTGIYRYMRHPNYLGVILELAALPLIFRLWGDGGFFQCCQRYGLMGTHPGRGSRVGINWMLSTEVCPCASVLAILATMSPRMQRKCHVDIHHQLITILHRYCGVRQHPHHPIGIETRFQEDLELDSMGLLTLAAEVENHWQVYLDEPPEHPPQTVGELVALIVQRLQEQRRQTEADHDA